jgi:hypothetical protein
VRSSSIEGFVSRFAQALGSSSIIGGARGDPRPLRRHPVGAVLSLMMLVMGAAPILRRSPALAAVAASWRLDFLAARGLHLASPAFFFLDESHPTHARSLGRRRARRHAAARAQSSLRRAARAMFSFGAFFSYLASAPCSSSTSSVAGRFTSTS